MATNELENQISELLEYGHFENDIFTALKEKYLEELGENSLKNIIKAICVENYLILKHRRLDKETLSQKISTKFEIPSEISDEIVNLFDIGTFSSPRSLIKEILFR